MSERVTQTTYFDVPGARNTDRTLALAKARAEELGIHTVLVATTWGETGRRVAEAFRGYRVVAITHSAGFSQQNERELTEENRAAILAAGAEILTCQHAFDAVNRPIRSQPTSYEMGEIVAFALRTFGEGVKVVCEIALMAADAGLARTDEEVLAIAGTSRGADTAVILKPANVRRYFDLRVLEVICKPRGG